MPTHRSAEQPEFFNYKAAAWAFHSEAPGLEKLVLIGLASHVHPDRKHAFVFPSVEYVAKELGINERTVRRCIKRLINRGYVRDSGQRKGYQNRVKVYELAGRYRPLFNSTQDTPNPDSRSGLKPD